MKWATSSFELGFLVIKERVKSSKDSLHSIEMAVIRLRDQRSVYENPLPPQKIKKLIKIK